MASRIRTFRARFARQPEGWVVARARKTIRKQRGRALRRSAWLHKLANAGPTALLFALGVCASGAVAILFMRLIWPADDPSGVGGLWQVQAAIAAATLPILGLIIQLTGEQGQVGARMSEVLTRVSWAFPLVALSLVATLLIGWADVHLSHHAALWTARTLLVLTVVASIFAYYQSLHAITNPVRARLVANEIAKSRVRDSVEISAARRIAANDLVGQLEAIGAEYIPFLPHGDASTDWHVVETERAQEVSDINIDLLRMALGALPPPRASMVEDDMKASVSTPPQQPIRLLKLPGQRTYDKERGLLAIHKSRLAPEVDFSKVRPLLRRAFRVRDRA